MEIELWWLLALPVFFALGWLAARIDMKQVVNESRKLPRTYLQGLSYLLNGQPDKAIDQFLQAMNQDPNSIELQFSLGKMFRRRGEFEQAIQIHQGLIENKEIDPKLHYTAQLSLAKDFLVAGLLDRAEELLKALQQEKPEDEQVNQYLLGIYQQEKEWNSAIQIANGFSDRGSIRWRRSLANFHCERALMLIAESQFDEANQQLDQAFQVNAQCVRVNVIRGDVLLKQGQLESALQAWKRIEHQNVDFLSLVADRIGQVYHQMDKSNELITLLESWQSRYPSLDLLDQLFRKVLETQGVQAAYEIVGQELKRHPTLLGLEKLLEVAVLLVKPDQRENLELVHNLVHEHTRRVARYTCQDCGFKVREFKWHCPACGGWETYPPKRTEEYDMTFT